MGDRFTPNYYRFHPNSERFYVRRCFQRMGTSYASASSTYRYPSQHEPGCTLLPSSIPGVQPQTSYTTPTNFFTSPPQLKTADVRRIIQMTALQHADMNSHIGTLLQGIFSDACLTDRQVVLWASLCHLSALVGLVFPWTNVIFPFLLWRKRRKESRFIDHHGLESVNFQLSVEACIFVAGLFYFPQKKTITLLIRLYSAAMAFKLSRLAEKRQQAEYPFALRILQSNPG